MCIKTSIAFTERDRLSSYGNALLLKLYLSRNTYINFTRPIPSLHRMCQNARSNQGKYLTYTLEIHTAPKLTEYFKTVIPCLQNLFNNTESKFIFSDCFICRHICISLRPALAKLYDCITLQLHSFCAPLEIRWETL